MMLSDVIRTRRQALGLTQEGLAARLGVSAPAVNKWERSIHYPRTLRCSPPWPECWAWI